VTEHRSVAVIGAGPAGLTAAYQLLEQGMRPLVLEHSDHVGGIARTETYKGYRFDIGGHRFYTKVPEIQALWEQMLGDDFLEVARLSRIYYGGKFYSYPLELKGTLSNLGLRESALILCSYLWAQVTPNNREETFEDWVSHRFGKRLYRTFFKTYTEKVWGIPCDQIQAEWAAQRIKGMSVRTAVMNALFGSNHAKSLIKAFRYPVLGPGMMWQRFEEWVEKHGGQVSLNTDVQKFYREGKRITAVSASYRKRAENVSADHWISSIPLSTLVQRIEPPAPEAVREAAAGLSYRAFILVGLIVDKPFVFPDNWIYVHSPHVHVGRIQNFKNWSPAMVPEPERTSLGMEYFCSEKGTLWNRTDEELIALAKDELAQLGLARAEDVVDGMVVRQPKAYPVYDRSYRRHLAVIQEFVQGLENLQSIGRNGLHRYNNQDHSMLTGLLAARRLAGEQHDVWNVNTERSYYEEFSRA